MKTFEKINNIFEIICYAIIFIFILKTIICVPIELYDFILNKFK
jgi:hypothetical protein